MASNTKLSFDEKEFLRDLRLEQKNVKVLNNGQTTIAYRVFPNTVEFSLAVWSLDEKKFRAKVGEYYARKRMEYNETVKMEKNDFYNMMGDVFNIYLD